MRSTWRMSGEPQIPIRPTSPNPPISATSPELPHIAAASQTVSSPASPHASPPAPPDKAPQHCKHPTTVPHKRTTGPPASTPEIHTAASASTDHSPAASTSPETPPSQCNTPYARPYRPAPCCSSHPDKTPSPGPCHTSPAPVPKHSSEPKSSYPWRDCSPSRRYFAAIAICC
jgi:hypothetical protein